MGKMISGSVLILSAVLIWKMEEIHRAILFVASGLLGFDTITYVDILSYILGGVGIILLVLGFLEDALDRKMKNSHANSLRE